VQWENPEIRNRMTSAVRAAMEPLRIRFEDITLEGTNWQKKTDGRRYTHYWDGDRKRYIYRNQWVWMQTNGPIPPGHQIHHKSEDKTDDSIENLQCLPSPKHGRLHMTREKSLRLVVERGDQIFEDRERVCQHCGKTFLARNREKGDIVNKHCSNACRIASMQTHRVCPTCGKEFIGGLDHGKPRKYCSRACFQTGHRSTI